MAKNDPVSQTRANLLKAIRSNVRLQHSLAAGNDLNDLIDAYSKQYDKSEKGGSIDLTAVYEKVLAAIVVKVEREIKRMKDRKALRP